MGRHHRRQVCRGHHQDIRPRRFPSLNAHCGVLEHQAVLRGDTQASGCGEKDIRRRFGCADFRVIGRDDIAIVTNITSVISKETGVTLRSLNIDSVDGIFQGNFTVMVRDTTALNMLTKKINAVKGVKTVERLNS